MKVIDKVELEDLLSTLAGESERYRGYLRKIDEILRDDITDREKLERVGDWLHLISGQW